MMDVKENTKGIRIDSYEELSKYNKVSSLALTNEAKIKTNLQCSFTLNRCGAGLRCKSYNYPL